MSAPASPPARAPWVRAVVDYAGLAALALAYLLTRNLLDATFAFVVASLVAVAFGFVMERRVAPMPLAFSIVALVFGVATLLFHDPRIIKMKTTVLDGALGLGLLGGYAVGKSPVKLLLSSTLQLSEEAWRRLTFRYGLFFLAMAAANEAVWRTQPDGVWVAFRSFGLVIASLLFSATQIPGMLKDSAAMEAALKLNEAHD